MFRDREDGGRQLAALLADYPFQNLLILAIPRGGLVTGAALARELGGELDVVLSRKLRAPSQPELAIGAISETGEVSLNQEAVDSLDSRFLNHQPLLNRSAAMAQDTLSVFEHTIQITDTWLNDLMERLGWHDKQRAYLALRAVLHALRDRLNVNEASHLAAQLPMLIRGFYYEGYHPSGKPLPEKKKSEFLAHVAAEFVDEDRGAGPITQAVLQVLAKHITPGEVEKLKGVLPPDIRALWT